MQKQEQSFTVADFLPDDHCMNDPACTCEACTLQETSCQECSDFMPLGGFYRAGKLVCNACDIKREGEA